MTRNPENGHDHDVAGHSTEADVVAALAGPSAEAGSHDQDHHSDHDHDHDNLDNDNPIHAPHDHTHAVSAESDRRYLTITLGLLTTYMAFEVATAFLSHSLALLADAGHMLADVGAIVGSLIALRLAQRDPRPVRTRSA